MNDLKSMVDLVLDCGIDTWNVLKLRMGVYLIIPITLFLMPFGKRLLKKIFQR